MTRCCAVLAGQWNHKIEKVQLCQQQAVYRIDGVPVCGTHVNNPPERVCIEYVYGFGTVEKI